MFNKIDELQSAIIDITKDINCYVYFGACRSEYIIEVRWTQNHKSFGYRKSFSKSMYRMNTESFIYIIQDMIKYITYEYGKNEYEALA